MKILIVDDSRAMQVIIRREIEQLGYHQLEFQHANDGVKALDIIRVWEPDLVISDWHMPEMNGLELLLRLNREMLDITIGLVTTENSHERLQEARDAGAHFIVQKPFTINTLHEAVSPIIKRRLDEKTALQEQVIQENTSASSSHKHDHIILPTFEELTTALQKKSSTSLHLQQAEPIVLDHNHYPYLLGLYGNNERQSVHAIAIADINAVCILGALQSDLKEECLNTLTKKTIPKNIMNSCKKIFRTLQHTLHHAGDDEHLTLSSSNIMRKNNPAIENLLTKKTNDRIDITLANEYISEGHLTFIVS